MDDELKWKVSSELKKFDGMEFDGILDREEVIQKLQGRMEAAGYDSYNLRWDSFTDQIFGYIRYADGKWRRIVNITPE